MNELTALIAARSSPDPTRREARANAREFREFGEARVRPYRRVEPKRRRKA